MDTAAEEEERRAAGRHTLYVGRRKRGEARVGDVPDQYSLLIFRVFLKGGERSDNVFLDRAMST